MSNTLASPADAELILKLYELRTEARMREARRWVGSEFWPLTLEEFQAVLQASGTDHNAYLRQVASYWEMAAAFVLRGALDADLFFDTNGENIFLYAKFYHVIKELQEKTGSRFMKLTAELLEHYPVAKERFDHQLKMMDARRQAMLAAR